jgi:hypothetical protein
MNWPHNFLPEDQLISLAGENDHLLLANEMAKEANKEDVLISDAVLDDPKKRDE